MSYRYLAKLARTPLPRYVSAPSKVRRLQRLARSGHIAARFYPPGSGKAHFGEVTALTDAGRELLRSIGKPMPADADEIAGGTEAEAMRHAGQEGRTRSRPGGCPATPQPLALPRRVLGGRTSQRLRSRSFDSAEGTGRADEPCALRPWVEGATS